MGGGPIIEGFTNGMQRENLLDNKNDPALIALWSSFELIGPAKIPPNPKLYEAKIDLDHVIVTYINAPWECYRSNARNHQNT